MINNSGLVIQSYLVPVKMFVETLCTVLKMKYKIFMNI